MLLLQGVLVQLSSCHANLMEEQVEVHTWVIVFLSSLASLHHSSIAASQTWALSKLIWKKFSILVVCVCVSPVSLVGA